MRSVLVFRDRAYRQTFEAAVQALGAALVVDSVETGIALCARVGPEVAIVEARLCGCDEMAVFTCVHRMRQAGAGAVVLVAHEFGEFQQESIVGPDKASAYVSGFGGDEMRRMVRAIQVLARRRAPVSRPLRRFFA
jgi:hypothetical protein